jgi:glycosyltransferase involved in cell wall biosynthesis
MKSPTSTSRTSVAMATYNGARWVEEQIASILSQLGSSDELIVVDDCSTDDTVRTVRAIRDSRIHIHENHWNIGYVRTFERALALTRGTHVFLADQDDIWPPGRLAIMRAALETGAVVAGNVGVLDGPPRIRGPFGEADWRLSESASRHTLRNVLRLAASDMPYFGSAMAVHRDLLELALPFPSSVRELHDAWLALLGLCAGSMVHVEERVVLRRMHESNVSGTTRSPWVVARGRLYFVGMCVAAWYRVHLKRPRMAAVALRDRARR